MKSMRRVTAHARLLLLIGGLVVILLPAGWAFSASLKPTPEIFSFTFQFLPLNPTTEHYEHLFAGTAVVRQFVNSVIVSTVSAGLAVIISAMAGYAFARFDFRGSRTLFAIVLVGLFVPWQVTLVPLFLMIVQAGLVDSLLGLVLPGAVSAFGVFFMRQYMLSIPPELSDAARIDGASELRLFLSIILPLAAPAAATVGTLVFVWNWNDFLWPLVVLRSPENYTLQLGIALLLDPSKIDYGLLMAASSVATVPILVLFGLTSRRIVDGIMGGAVRG